MSIGLACSKVSDLPESSLVPDVDIGKIRRVRLREVWRHEALDFTTWLEHNADVLSDALASIHRSDP